MSKVNIMVTGIMTILCRMLRLSNYFLTIKFGRVVKD